MVFSDATLAEIVGKKPIDVAALSRVEGMSVARLMAYYKEILAVVNKHVNGRKRIPNGSSDALSRAMYESGMSVEEIAKIRELQFTTVLIHLLKQIDAGLQFDCAAILPPEKFVALARVSELYNEAKKCTIQPDPKMERN